jgi:UDP-N-acetylmuramate dehydrogenase
LFGYRDSIFKRNLAKQAYITDVTFKLSKRPVLNTSYGAIAEELIRLGKTPSVPAVAEAVINIRRSKLPNPSVIGNAGSFFKNPTVNVETFRHLQSQFANMPFYDLGNEQYKIPAGWLIEFCGWKGHLSVSGAGVHDKQALVLVNKQKASGDAILSLSGEIIESVAHTFGIVLEREVQIW